MWEERGEGGREIKQGGVKEEGESLPQAFDYNPWLHLNDWKSL
jgi:hypothetical protein